MSDDLGPDLGAPAADIIGVPGEPPKPSSTKRIVIIVAAVVGLLAVFGVVAAVVLFTLGKSAVENAAVTDLNAKLNTPAAAVSTRTAEPTSTIEGNREVVEVSNKDVFTARDPFEPVLKPLPQVTASESVPATGSADWNTLVLQNIVTSNGQLTAILKWNGDTYTAVAGQQLASSPWQVLAITKTTVTMLYGDVQVTLSVGEGIAQ